MSAPTVLGLRSGCNIGSTYSKLAIGQGQTWVTFWLLFMLQAGGAGRGVLGRKKQRSQDAGRDPLKAAGTGFLKAPKKGGAANEQLTDIEVGGSGLG